MTSQIEPLLDTLGALNTNVGYLWGRRAFTAAEYLWPS